jgi:hypothetical protein
VTAYVDFVLEFVGEEERLAKLRWDRRSSGGYPTTEARTLREYHSENVRLSEKEELVSSWTPATSSKPRGPVSPQVE